MKILLLNLPETITVVSFLSILFYSMYKPTFIKIFTAFLLIFVSISACDYIANEVIASAAIILLSAVIWTLITKGIDIKYLGKSVLTVFICLVGMLAIQLWIPIYFMITGCKSSILNDVMTQFYLSIPCRIAEYIILFLIYVFKIKPIIAASVLAGLSKRVVSVASIWWIYQPKTPKGLR